MSQTTTAVITFIDANGNKASVFLASNGHPSGPSGVLMQLHAAKVASAHSDANFHQFDAGNLAAAFIAANWNPDDATSLYVCRKPKQVDARFRYYVTSNRALPEPTVECYERDDGLPLFITAVDANMGLVSRPRRLK
jgi:hypothetical protein